MDITKYKSFPDIFLGFSENSKINVTELARALDCSTQLISQYRSGKKIPSVEILKKFCRIYQLNEGYCLQLREQLLNKNNNKKSKDNGNSQDDHNDEGVDDVRVDKGIEKTNQAKDEPIEQAILGQLDEIKQLNPKLLSILYRISSYSDNLQEKAIEHLEEYADTLPYNMIKRFKHHDLKERLVTVFDLWKRGWNATYETKQGDMFKLDGFIELNNYDFYVSMEANEHYITLVTRLEERHHLNEFLNLAPGVVFYQQSKGELGKAYKITHIHTVHVFNPSILVNHIKNELSKLKVGVSNIQTENEFLAPYF